MKKDTFSITTKETLMMQETILPDMLLTVKDVAELLSVAPRTVFRWARQQKAAPAGEAIAAGCALAGQRHSGVSRPIDGRSSLRGPVRERRQLIKGKEQLASST